MTTETDQTDRNPTTYTAADGTRYEAVDSMGKEGLCTAADNGARCSCEGKPKGEGK
jgi:hypothetical protein